MEPPKNGRDEEAEGKSRGGLSTKIHAAVDGPGYPLRFFLTGGQASEYGQSERLIAGFPAEHVLADKGYDSNTFIELIESQGSLAVMPPRRHRKEQRDYDKEVYKERNLVERCFLKLKSYRRIATRYERLARNYLSMLYLVSAVIWLA
jgi:transposase